MAESDLIRIEILSAIQIIGTLTEKEQVLDQIISQMVMVMMMAHTLVTWTKFEVEGKQSQARTCSFIVL